MSIVFSGTRSRSGGVLSAIAKQVKLLNLKPLTKITVRFDPFHDKVAQTRDFLFYLSGPRVAQTNLSCLLKTEIVCNRAEPLITCDFEVDEKLILKSENLTALELLKLFNQHVSSRVKPEVDESEITKKKKKKKSKRRR